MNDILCRQIALDYCCAPEEVMDSDNHFTGHKFLEGRRRYEERGRCFLKIAGINGKLLFCGDPQILEWCRSEYRETGSEWFFEAKNMRRINDRLHRDGYQIEMIHPFYITDRITEADTGEYDILWYEGADIEQFRGDARFNKAYTFDTGAPDMLGVGAARDGQILGMAGASCDSPAMWQIGINVNPDSRKRGIGTLLVTLLKNELIKKGILPFYGTSVSHIGSQKVALGSGFMPAWIELSTSAASGRL